MAGTSGRPRKNIEQDDIIRSLKIYRRAHGEWPTQAAFNDWLDNYSTQIVVTRFGSWSAALEAAKENARQTEFVFPADER